MFQVFLDREFRMSIKMLANGVRLACLAHRAKHVQPIECEVMYASTVEVWNADHLYRMLIFRVTFENNDNALPVNHGLIYIYIHTCVHVFPFTFIADQS